MAKDEKKTQAPSAPAASIPSACPVESCKGKPHRASFCSEHFEWFKYGLVNRKGQKPSDFDKKFQLYQRKRAA